MLEAHDGGSLEARRKQLLFRCRRRGFKELDLIFGVFAESHLDSLDAAELDQLRLLLQVSDDDVYGWLRGYEAPPARYASSVFEKLKALCSRKSPAWNV